MTVNLSEIEALVARARACPSSSLRTDLFTVQDLANEAERIAAKLKPVLAEIIADRPRVARAMRDWSLDETYRDYLRRTEGRGATP